MPLRRLLILVSGIQQLAFREVRPDELQTLGQPMQITAGQRQTRQVSRVRADGIDIVQIHGDRIIHFRTPVEGQIHLLERRSEVVGDEAADFLRLQTN